ncbi:MAG: DUF459 domain-containing protein [Nitriliruptorales bacterium]|nr:DUF459 domain-containing protein [Nitriliruptorales bacterium]
MSRRDRSPRPMAAGHVIVVIVVALLGGGILNAAALTDTAARQPFGWKRNLAVVAATPFRGVAGLLGLDRAHSTLTRAAAQATQPRPELPVVQTPTPVTDEPTPAPSAASEQATGAPSEKPTGPRTPSRRDPLRVWVGGDSLSSEFGPALADRLARTGRAGAEVEYRFSTGLSRPDYFNWPARLRAVVKEQDPEVFVVMFGANDGQNIAVDDTVLPFGSEEWMQEYAARVDAVMNTMTRNGATLLWVGQPIMRAPDFDQKMQLLTGIYRARSRGRSDVRYLDSRDLFSADGAFSPYLEDDDGQSVLMRQQDGVHFTRAGGERLTDVVFAEIAGRFEIAPDDG